MMQLQKQNMSASRSVFLFKTYVLGTLSFLGCLCAFAYGTISQSSTISLEITNTFTAGIAVTNSGYSSGSTLYISGTEVVIEASATATSQYTISGDLLTGFVGTGVGNYTVTLTGEVTTGDGTKIITGQFLKGREALYPAPIYLYLDTTVPTSSTPLSPSIGSTQGGPSFSFSRSASTDIGAGIKEYDLIISSSPAFTTTTTYTTTLTSLSIDQNLIPAGILYRYIRSKDQLENSKNGTPSFFTNQLSGYVDTMNDTSSSHGGGGGGAGSSTNTNTSPSINTDNTTDLQNNTDTDVDTNLQGAPEISTPLSSPVYTKYVFSIFTKKEHSIASASSALLKVLRKRIQDILDIFNTSNQKTFIEKFADVVEQVRIASTPKRIISSEGRLDYITGEPLGKNLFKLPNKGEKQKLLEQLNLLSRYFPDEQQQFVIQSLIDYLMPRDDIGVLLILFVLGYDIQTYNLWYLNFLWSRKKVAKKV